jgi:hypothetical protein
MMIGQLGRPTIELLGRISRVSLSPARDISA